MSEQESTTRGNTTGWERDMRDTAMAERDITTMSERDITTMSERDITTMSERDITTAREQNMTTAPEQKIITAVSEEERVMAAEEMPTVGDEETDEKTARPTSSAADMDNICPQVEDDDHGVANENERWAAYKQAETPSHDDSSTEHSEPVPVEERQSPSPPPHTECAVRPSMWECLQSPILGAWSSLHFFHVDEAPWHRLQQDSARSSTPIAPTTTHMSAEEWEAIEAQLTPPPAVTNRMAKTSWSRAMTMYGATAILLATLVGLIICVVACTYHAATRSYRLSGVQTTPPSTRPMSPICIAPAQSTTADDLLTGLLHTARSMATAHGTEPNTTRLIRAMTTAEASLSQPLSTLNTFHQAVIRIQQAESLLLPIDQAILLGANPLAGSIDEDLNTGVVLEEAEGHLRTKACPAVAVHLHVHGPTCLRVALHTSRRLRTEVLGIRPMAVSV